MNLLLRYKEWFILLGMMVLAAIFTEGLYLSPVNLTNVLRVVAPSAIMAMGMTFVILTAGIDLSVGSILALACVLSAMLLGTDLIQLPLPVVIAIVIPASLLIGALCGALQGVLIAFNGIQPFVITLAGLTFFRGLAKYLTDNNKIQYTIAEGEKISEAEAFAELFSSKPMMIGILVVVTILAWCLLRFTVFGRIVRAVGDNERAAIYAGLPMNRVKILVYAISGALAGLAGLMACARNRTGDPNVGFMAELEVIAMVVIGGTSLAGGRGRIGGTVLGVLILGTVTNVLGLENVDSNIKSMLMAVIIVLAVFLQVRRKQI